MKNAYPLHWPTGYKRNERRISSKFKLHPMKAQEFLRNEIKLLGATGLIVSSDVSVRIDGLIYADMSQSQLKDPGVAIYFKWKSKDVVMCADQYLTPIENLIALAKGIEALRGMSRWGVSEFMDRAFSGFQALPESTKRNWWQILEVNERATTDEIKESYRKLVKKNHPDVGGSVEKFQEIQSAYQQVTQ